MTLFELLMGWGFWEIQDDHQDGHQYEVHSENDLLEHLLEKKKKEKNAFNLSNQAT